MSCLYTLLLLSSIGCVYGQSEADVLKYLDFIDSTSIANNQAIELTIRTQKRNFNEMRSVVIEFTNHDSDLSSRFDLGDFEIKKVRTDSGTYILKRLSKSEVVQHRVRYIYLNGHYFNRADIDSTRQFLMEKLEKGSNFKWLARTYSMDGNSKRGGDMGWVDHSSMRSEFSEVVVKKKLNEVFTIDIESMKWHYLVLKTHEDRQALKTRLIMVKCDCT